MVLNMVGFEVKIEDWKEQIQWAYRNGSTQDFHDAIWAMSTYAFDIPREVQVVIDRHDMLFMSVGTPGFVSFDGHFPKGMVIPLKEWIHTHPFGQAYFSGTDKNTVKIWHSLLESATVLGKHQKAELKFRVLNDGKDHLYTHSERENRWNTVNQVMNTLWGDEEE
jgi:hypothetical protein